MTFTFDTTGLVGKVRAITGDVNSSSAVLTDEQINVFLGINSNDILLSAAMALRTMASSKALVAKYRSAGNYTEDTRNIAKDLLAVAEILEDRAINTPADAQSEIIYTDFDYNQLIRNKTLRGEPLDES